MHEVLQFLREPECMAPEAASRIDYAKVSVDTMVLPGSRYLLPWGSQPEVRASPGNRANNLSRVIG
jgi:hypothetical protein